MLTKTEIRIHFFLIMASVLLFAVGFIEFQKFIGIQTNLGRTVGMFFAGYAWFFLMIRLWIAYLQRSPRMLKRVAAYSEPRKSGGVGDWGSFTISTGIDIIDALLMVVGVAIIIVFVGHFLIIEAPILLIDAAFEFAVAGGLIRVLRRPDPEAWMKLVFKRTWGLFLFGLILGCVYASSIDYCYSLIGAKNAPQYCRSIHQEVLSSGT